MTEERANELVKKLTGYFILLLVIMLCLFMAFTMAATNERIKTEKTAQEANLALKESMLASKKASEEAVKVSEETSYYRRKRDKMLYGAK